MGKKLSLMALGDRRTRENEQGNMIAKIATIICISKALRKLTM